MPEGCFPVVARYAATLFYPLAPATYSFLLSSPSSPAFSSKDAWYSLSAEGSRSYRVHVLGVRLAWRRLLRPSERLTPVTSMSCGTLKTFVLQCEWRDYRYLKPSSSS
jgi:hypothetical protein